MKAGIVGVPVEDFLKVARQTKGLTVIDQKGFHKITGDVPGKAVYPQRNKIVGEVHYSGFAQEPSTKIPGLVANPKWPKPTKRVTHFLDQREGLSKEQILENFRRTISSMVSTVEVKPIEFVPTVPAPEPIAVAAETMGDRVSAHVEYGDDLDEDEIDDFLLKREEDEQSQEEQE
jgi:hypothetical protein